MRTVLVLEDDPQIMNLYRLLLPSTECSVLEATSAEQAYQCMDEADWQVDLIIADVNPNLAGIGVALALQSLLPNLRVLLTSGYPPDFWDDRDREDLDRLPPEVTTFVQKPLNIVALVQEVHRVIGLPTRAAPALQATAGAAVH